MCKEYYRATRLGKAHLNKLLSDRGGEVQMTNVLIEALSSGEALGHSVDLIETHISWILLAGEYVYKIKKPLNLGFLDFSGLEKREYYCHEEIRLNKVLAPNIYLDVVKITGTASAPVIGGSGSAIEYAVRMRRLPQSALLARCLAKGQVPIEKMAALAEMIARFHTSLSDRSTDKARDFGSPQVLITPVRENFRLLNSISHDQPELVDRLTEWTQRQYGALLPVFYQRLADGMIRECHGDLHVGNVFYDETGFILFDRVEFSESLRWIDTMSDIAFMVMDLCDKGLAAHGNRLLNCYLEYTGDYAGLRVFDFYFVYRALVRAKIHLLESTRMGASRASKHQSLNRFRHYLQLAWSRTCKRKLFLGITHGVSGTGKSTVARNLADDLGAIQVRSDVERKRLYGLGLLDRSRCRGIDIYTSDASNKTYARLAGLVREVIAAGFTVIVDAVFIERSRREHFCNLGDRLDVGFVLFDCVADENTILRRLELRGQAGTDPSEAELAQYLSQLRHQEPLTESELSRSIQVDTTRRIDLVAIRRRLEKLAW
jgi:aminoglycoside phosphotransferase family enzyme/predicted kinase